MHATPSSALQPELTSRTAWSAVLLIAGVIHSSSAAQPVIVYNSNSNASFWEAKR